MLAFVLAYDLLPPPYTIIATIHALFYVYISSMQGTRPPYKTN